MYFESVLKTGKVNIWVRNVHLAWASIVMGEVNYLSVCYTDGQWLNGGLTGLLSLAPTSSAWSTSSS